MESFALLLAFITSLSIAFFLIKYLKRSIAEGFYKNLEVATKREFLIYVYCDSENEFFTFVIEVIDITLPDFSVFHRQVFQREILTPREGSVLTSKPCLISRGIACGRVLKDNKCSVSDYKFSNGSHTFITGRVGDKLIFSDLTKVSKCGALDGSQLDSFVQGINQVLKPQSVR